MDRLGRGPSENLLELIVRSKDALRRSDRRIAEGMFDRPAAAVDMLARARRIQFCGYRGGPESSPRMHSRGVPSSACPAARPPTRIRCN